MGDFPLMTEAGTFVINGTERVVVSQLVRSPGAYFEKAPDRTSDKDIYSARVIPSRGAWFELEIDKRDQVGVRLDRKRKQSVTVLLKALGWTESKILAEFGQYDSIRATLEKDSVKDRDEALLDIYRKLRPGEPPTVEAAQALLDNMYFTPRRYDLAKVGRYKLNRKLGVDVPLDSPEASVLSQDDIAQMIRYLCALHAGETSIPGVRDGKEISLKVDIDDIDHFGNRRIRTVGELIENQIRTGLSRMERVVRERMTTQDVEAVSYTHLDVYKRQGMTSLLVAMPIFIGAIGRIPVGGLTDRYGGRIMFTIVLAVSAPLVLLVGVAGQMNSLPMLLIVSFFLGIAGTVFAVGIPFSSAWYDASKKGFATGVFGAGMVGTAVSAFATPRLVQGIGYFPTHILIAVICAVTAVISFVFLKDSPATIGREVTPLMPKIVQAFKVKTTWQLCFLYAVVFGAFVAFSNYLPTYLSNIYNFNANDAGCLLYTSCCPISFCRPLPGTRSTISPRPICTRSCTRSPRQLTRRGRQRPTTRPLRLSHSSSLVWRRSTWASARTSSRSRCSTIPRARLLSPAVTHPTGRTPPVWWAFPVRTCRTSSPLSVTTVHCTTCTPPLVRCSTSSVRPPSTSPTI